MSRTMFELVIEVPLIFGRYTRSHVSFVVAQAQLPLSVSRRCIEALQCVLQYSGRNPRNAVQRDLTQEGH